MKKNLEEKTISTKQIFHGKIIDVNLTEVELPNGKTAQREIVNHPGAVGILAITDENKIILIKQFRKAIEKTIIEIPAGKLEKNEDPKVCAYRELKEETGYIAKDMIPLGKIYTSPGFANEVIYLYKAEGLIADIAEPDEDEFLELLELSFTEIKELIDYGEFFDAKTLIAINNWQIETISKHK